MEHILTARGIDFEAYCAYLDTVRDRLPTHVAAFAGDPRHHSLTDRESLHDAWVESVVVREDGRGPRSEERTASIELRLLGAFHDRVHVLRYASVRRYELSGPGVAAGHGDLHAHEVRLARDGVSVEHELLFHGRPGENVSRVLVECADFTHETIVPGRDEDRASERILDILALIGKRPSMYLGGDESSRGRQLDALQGVLSGYALALYWYAVGQADIAVLGELESFLRARAGADNLTAIDHIRAAESDDQKAWDAVWSLIEEFLAARR